MSASKSIVIFYNKEIIEIKKGEISKLKEQAVNSNLKRARLCFHRDHNDKVHEMVIAFCKDSYNRPHRHIDKSESFHIIEGEMFVILFDDKGNVTHRIKMGPVGSGLTFFYRLSSGLWHTVIPITEFVVMHETTPGPFVEGKNEFADWSPGYGDDYAVRAFLAKIYE